MAVLKVSGISKTVFLAGLIIAILASSVISVVAMTQLSTTLGLKGDTGATGATGPQGPKGDKGDTGATGAVAMAGYVSMPAFDSGWTQVPGGGTYRFFHLLGTTNVIVDLTRNATLTGNQDDQGIQGLSEHQRLRWYNLTNTDVFVEDGVGGPHSIRVMMWIINEP